MTWIQTASGRRFDLATPRAADVDFTRDVPEALARLARFTGHIGSGPYSVAQHCVHCCDVVMGETRDVVAAAYALLHDAHEAYIGDWSTPLKQAIVEVSSAGSSGDPQADLETAHLRWTLNTLEHRVAEAVHEAAGLPLSLCPARAVKDIDYRMLHAERRQLLDTRHRPGQAWWYDGTRDEPRPIRSLVLAVWPWTKAADAYRMTFHTVVPKAIAALRERGDLAA